jgi:hypothetical protein
MTPPRRERPVRRRLADAAWIVLGVGLYAICVDIFGGYPQVHSEALSWAAVILIVVLGAVIWYRHERRDDD